MSYPDRDGLAGRLQAGGPLVVTARSDARSGRPHPESAHRGHLVVVDGDGARVGELGDPDLPVFVRSAAKPFQATACLELLSEGPGRLGEPSAREIAVGWASHRALPDQLAAVRRLLARSGTSPDELTCPSAARCGAPGAGRRPLLHNCSGKHAMFALAGAALQVAGPRLVEVDGPVQVRVLAVLEQALGPPAAVAVDGCGAPAVAVPLVALARGYVALITEQRWSRVVAAGLTHPGLVGGPGELVSALLAAGVVAKSGAEGVYAAAWRDQRGEPRAVALKAADGASRAAATALWALVRELELAAPDAWHPPVPLGGGQPVGSIRPSPQLEALVAQL